MKKRGGGETRKNINSHIKKAEALNILYEDIMYIINEYEYIIDEYKKCQQSLTNKQKSLINLHQIVNEDGNIGSTRLDTLKRKLEKIKNELQPTSGGKSKPKSKTKKKNYKKKTINKRKTRNKRKRNKRRKTHKKKK